MQEKLAILNCRRLPARLNTSEVAILLGLQEHDIAILVAAKLLTPLGKPARNSPKYFPAIEIATRIDDRDWLSKATESIGRYWRRKNSQKKISV